MATQFELNVVSAEQKIFTGQVVSVRVTGVDGELGVYAVTALFLSTLGQ